MAEYNLGGYLMGIPGREPEAVTHFQEVLRIKPEAYGVHSEICAYLLQTGHTAEAIAQFEAALRTARRRSSLQPRSRFLEDSCPRSRCDISVRSCASGGSAIRTRS